MSCGGLVSRSSRARMGSPSKVAPKGHSRRRRGCLRRRDIAVAATLLGPLGEAPTRVRGVDGMAVRFPRVVGTLRALGAEVHIEQRTE